MRLHADGGSPAIYCRLYRYFYSVLLLRCYSCGSMSKSVPLLNERPDTGTAEYESLVERMPLAAWQRSCSEDWRGYLDRL